MASSASDSPSTHNEITWNMREEWDRRALENARHYVATERTEWSDEEYFESGRENVRREILSDMINIYQDKKPKHGGGRGGGGGAGRGARARAGGGGEGEAGEGSGEM